MVRQVFRRGTRINGRQSSRDEIIVMTVARLYAVMMSPTVEHLDGICYPTLFAAAAEWTELYVALQPRRVRARFTIQIRRAPVIGLGESRKTGTRDRNSTGPSSDL